MSVNDTPGGRGGEGKINGGDGGLRGSVTDNAILIIIMTRKTMTKDTYLC